MDYYIETEILKKDKKNNEEIEETTKNSDEETKKVKVYVLYKNGYRVAYVKYNDCRYHGMHGYSVCAINQNLLDQFQKEARERFPNSENPYIRFLDLLFPIREMEVDKS